MANATNTIAGDIQLAGDLAGNNNAASPALTNTGVVPGIYTTPKITVDAKGRITSAQNDTITPATATTSGGVIIGDNINVSAGVISVPAATNTTLGVVKSANTDNVVITAGNIDVGPKVVLLNVPQTFTKAHRVATVALTAGTTTVDASLSNVFTLTLTENSTLSNPTNLLPGSYTFIITQDTTGGWSLAYGSAYKFQAGDNKLVSPGISSISILDAISDGTSLYCTLRTSFV